MTGFRRWGELLGSLATEVCAGCVLAVLWPATGHWVEAHYIAPMVDAFRTIF